MSYKCHWATSLHGGQANREGYCDRQTVDCWSMPSEILPTASAQQLNALVRPDEIGIVALYAGAASLPLVSHRYAGMYWDYSEDSLKMIQRCFYALLISSQLQQNPSANLALKADAAHGDLSKYTHANVSVKSIRGSIKANLPIPRRDLQNELRKCLQGLSDFVSNFTKFNNSSKDVKELWESLYRSFEKPSYKFRIAEMQRSLAEFFESRTWKVFSSKLMDSSGSWALCVGWYKYRFGNVSDGNFPSFLWRHWERRVVELPIEVWAGTPVEVNKVLSEIALQILDEFVEQEVSKDQNRQSITFSISDKIHIDKIYDENFDKKSNIIVSEIIVGVEKLVQRCGDNSDTYVRQDAEDYLRLFSGEAWSNSSSVVIRGNKLRVHLARQEEASLNSEIPSLNEKALVELENVVGIHNLLVQTSPDLKIFDEQLRNIDGNASGDPRNTLKRIISTAETAVALDRNAKSILESLPEFQDRNIEVANLKLYIIISNLVRAVMRYLWENKKSLAAGAVALPVSFYAIGKWALANEVVLLGYFAEGSNIHIVIRSLIEWLHTLPLV